MDNVSSEHLKNCNPRLASMLALCFTKMFSHGYLPANMLSVQLVPIIKSKSGLISSKDNYRPIAITSVLSKVLEFITVVYKYEFCAPPLSAVVAHKLMDVLESHLPDTQAGFRPARGCRDNVCALKWFIIDTQ